MSQDPGQGRAPDHGKWPPAWVWLVLRIALAAAALFATFFVVAIAGCYGSGGFCSGEKSDDAVTSVAFMVALSGASVALVFTRRAPLIVLTTFVAAVAGAALGVAI